MVKHKQADVSTARESTSVDDREVPPIGEQLRQCIKAVLKCEVGTPQHRKAMDKLLGLILKLPGISQYQHPQIERQEVLNLAYAGVNRNFSGFLPLFELDIDRVQTTYLTQCFVKWFNTILKRKLFDLCRKQKIQPLSLDVAIAGEGGKTTHLEQLCTETINGVDALIERQQQQHNQTIGLRLRQYIKTDPDRKLRNCRPCETPNCQQMAERLLLKEPPDKISEIAREFNVSNQTLYSRWKRNYLPLLQEIAKNFGYEQEEVR